MTCFCFPVSNLSVSCHVVSYHYENVSARIGVILFSLDYSVILRKPKHLEKKANIQETDLRERDHLA